MANVIEVAPRERVYEITQTGISMLVVAAQVSGQVHAALEEVLAVPEGKQKKATADSAIKRLPENRAIQSHANRLDRYGQGSYADRMRLEYGELCKARA